MNILIIGSGGREHAIGLCLKKSITNPSLFFAPGNAGTAQIGSNISIKDNNLNQLLIFAQSNSINFTVVGPEAPLVDGIVDLFEAHNLSIIGPSKLGAQLEGSKQWAKNLMKKYNIPTASFEVFDNYNDAVAYLNKKNQYPIVIKADGLAAGKGVTVAETEQMALSALKKCFIDKEFSSAGLKVVIEDFLFGEEASLFAFTDAKTIKPMIPAQDHKAVFEGDKGPNTGGMGAYCPTNLVTKEIKDTIMKTVFNPLLKAFQQEGISYKGIVYAGLMISESNDVSIVEFNVRFGDPETQVVLPLLETDLVDVFQAILNQTLDSVDLKWSNDYAACVVLASGGYPGNYEKNKEISGLTSICNDVTVIHAGTKANNSGIYTNGGRVLGVVSKCTTLETALDSIYSNIDSISFDGMFYRSDIGFKALSKSHLSTKN
jgi:phosphoribosylamine---glycine ligase